MHFVAIELPYSCFATTLLMEGLTQINRNVKILGSCLGDGVFGVAPAAKFEMDYVTDGYGFKKVSRHGCAFYPIGTVVHHKFGKAPVWGNL